MDDREIIASSAPAASAAISASAGTPSLSGGLGNVVNNLAGGSSLGETDVGRLWCLKALHPAESSVLTAPMPVNETRQFSSVHFVQMDVQAMPATFDPAKTWNLTLFVFRDPCLLYAWQKTQDGAAVVNGYTFATQYNNATYSDGYIAIRDACEKFRITSHAITAYFDGASETDQGHVVCGQTEFPRMKANPMFYGTLGVQAALPMTYWQDPPPNYDNIVQATRSFQGPARGGVYAPSKLQALGKWTTTNEGQNMFGSSSGQFTALGRSLSYAENDLPAWYNTFPYMVTGAGVPFPIVYDQADTSLTTIFFRGISATSQVRTTMRWTMDMLVRPATVWAPFVRMPPIEDHLALKMYAEVSRRMADGYPGSYNALGALLPIIASIASQVFPFVSNAVGKWIAGRQANRQARAARHAFYDPPTFMEQLARGMSTDASGGISAATFAQNAAPILTALGGRRRGRIPVRGLAAAPAAPPAAAPVIVVPAAAAAPVAFRARPDQDLLLSGSAARRTIGAMSRAGRKSPAGTRASQLVKLGLGGRKKFFF